MGCCGGDSSEDSSNSRNIDAQLKKDKAKMRSEVKLLLLGTGESGKSTILKQMKIIHQEGYSEQERVAFKDIIYNNIIQGMKCLIANAAKLGIKIDTAENEARSQCIAGLEVGEAWSTEIGTEIAQLWTDQGIIETYNRRSEFQLDDSVKYYFDDLERINSASFVPTEQDILRSRVRTTGIVEIQFVLQDFRFRIFDVGGQRNERKKWIHCFQDVTAVIFCVAISEYDQKLFEDESQNRMKESLLLFDEICNSRWFLDTSMILFLNKTDIFREKIQKTDLSVCFPSYKGGKDYEKATVFIRQRFEELNKTDTKQIYTHFTCATDTNNIKIIFNAVKDIILQKALRDLGF